jgi:hypothetical protein
VDVALEGGKGVIEQNKSGWVPYETNHNSYLHVIGYKTIFTFIGYIIIQLFSLDRMPTIIHFGLAALTFLALYFTSRAPRSSCYHDISLSRTADQTMPVTAFWT